MKIDMHIHTNFSDGIYSPSQIVDLALDSGLDAIAITDHDNVLAYDIALNYAKSLHAEGKKLLEIIRGVEINTIYNGYEIHILGYFMNPENENFKKLLISQQNAREKQAREILSLLNKKAGIKIDFERGVKSLIAQNGSVGRPHIARAIANAGAVSNVAEAYEKFINDKSPVFVQRKTATPHEAVETIYEAGAIPVFAHPIDVEIADTLIQELMNYGLRGIEAYHRKHTPAVVEHYSSLAEKLGLIITGGSDFHAPNPQNGSIMLGKNFVPDWIYDEVMQEKTRLELT